MLEELMGWLFFMWGTNEGGEEGDDELNGGDIDDMWGSSHSHSDE